MTDAPTTPSPERQPADAGGELLPCPFCGTEPAVNRTERAITVGCDFNECPARECYSAGRVEEETDVIAAWNRRAPAPQAQPDARAVEALRRMERNPVSFSHAASQLARETLQALSAPAADDGWRDISTAPKDGMRVLLIDAVDLNPNQQAVPIIAFWNNRGGWDDGDYYDHLTGFTHWRPLPAPPVALHPDAPTDEVGKS